MTTQENTNFEVLNAEEMNNVLGGKALRSLSKEEDLLDPEG